MTDPRARGTAAGRSAGGTAPGGPAGGMPPRESVARFGITGILGAGGTLLVLVVVVVVVGVWHLTQGTSGIGIAEFAGLLTDPASSSDVRDVLLGSRLPRLAAGITVGFALGVAGALFQSLSRNALASPDTLAVTAGAHLSLTAVAAFGLSIPIWASGAVAAVGGLLAAAVVLGLAGGAAAASTRLVLAGSALAMALQAGTATLLILFSEETAGLFAWGSGTLSQLGLTAFLQAAPVVVVVTVGALLLARRLDVLGLGEDTASALGVPVRSTRALGTVLAVLLTAVAVTLAGPIGFVGLCAPVLARLLARLVPALHRHGILIPAAGLLGAILVVLADAVLRAILGADAAISIPTGVATTLLGAIVLVILARRSRDWGPTRTPPGMRLGVRSRRRFVVVVVVGVTGLAATLLLGLLAGHSWLLTGDIAVWLHGSAPPNVGIALDERSPRIVAAILAGAALGLAGALVQGTTRNPLAEPGLLGITGGAGLAAVAVVTAGLGGLTGMLVAATVGALVAFGVVYGMAWRRGLDADRLVLVGIGVWYGASALTTFLLLRSDPWNTPRIYTWLSGTTYGRVWEQVVPVGIVLVVGILLAIVLRRELDLLGLDEDSPRLAGVSLERTRLVLLVTAALLAAMSVAAVGVVAFVGLVAPHMARALVGGRSARVVPVSVLVGAVLLGVADTVGRTLIAPAQIPAGLVVALLGAPYFVYLLARSRAR